MNTIILVGSGLHIFNTLSICENIYNKSKDFFNNINNFYGTSSGGLLIPILISNKINEFYNFYNNNNKVVTHLPILDNIPIINYLYKFLFMFLGYGYYKSINMTFIKECIDNMDDTQKNKLHNSFVVAFDINNNCERFLQLNGETDLIIKKLLCTSCLYPIFPIQKIENYELIDGAYSEYIYITENNQQNILDKSTTIYTLINKRNNTKDNIINLYKSNYIFKFFITFMPLKLLIIIINIFNKFRYEEYYIFKEKFKEKIIENICNIDDNGDIISLNNYYLQLLNINNINKNEVNNLYDIGLKRNLIINE
jgi:predicted patatin/cPLA2 family phospholipase